MEKKIKLFVKGKMGCGKTTFVNTIRDILKKRIAESKKAKKGTKNVKENKFKKDDKKKKCNI